jgi:hypothetical protein
VRCDVPKGVLKEGLEPVKVTADGNCLFRSISKVITGSEDDHLLFKLAVVVHGCSNEQHYQKNIHVCNISTKMDQRWHDALLVYLLVVLVCVFFNFNFFFNNVLSTVHIFLPFSK